MQDNFITAPHPNDTGLAQIAALMSDQTCGEACWHAREEVCRCSCGGLNHGCLKEKNGKSPARSAKIDGFPYVLVAVGIWHDLYKEASHLNSVEVAGYQSVMKINDEMSYHYTWKETDKGAPARLRNASKAQLAGWRELAPWKDTFEAKMGRVALLWKRVKSLQDAAKMQSPINV